MTRPVIILPFFVLLGCAVAYEAPVLPLTNSAAVSLAGHPSSGPHRIWGTYAFVFDEHDLECQVVPLRNSHFHLNALKLLEGGPCVNCVSIGNLHSLGGGAVELDVTIRHPYYSLVHSAFDVKGIIMFEGSWKVMINNPPESDPGCPYSFLSWALLGDWELLNPDGYTFYWSPVFNADSEWPITKYFPGKFSKGTPNSAINAYKEFYTDEERHLFRAGYSVTRTYRIQTQPGPMVVGYAVDACWEPPLVTPVLDPLTHFPPTANQPEPYRFEVVINDGEPVKKYDLWPPEEGGVKAFIDQWNGMTMTEFDAVLEFEYPDQFPTDEHPEEYVWPPAGDLVECKWPCGDNCYCGMGYKFACEDSIHPPCPAGWYRWVTVVYRDSGTWPKEYYDYAVTVTDLYFVGG